MPEGRCSFPMRVFLGAKSFTVSKADLNGLSAFGTLKPGRPKCQAVGQVLYLGVREDEGLAAVREVAAASREALEDIGLQGGRDSFVPHVTVAKLSKLRFLERRRLKRIPEEAYEANIGIRAGSAELTAVQLCRMGVLGPPHLEL